MCPSDPHASLLQYAAGSTGTAHLAADSTGTAHLACTQHKGFRVSYSFLANTTNNHMQNLQLAGIIIYAADGTLPLYQLV